jgi:hypothetical protein
MQYEKSEVDGRVCVQMERRFRAVNGILIPGGGQDLSPGHPYYDAVEFLFDLAVKENDAGVLYPVGICFLFQSISINICVAAVDGIWFDELYCTTACMVIFLSRLCRYMGPVWDSKHWP